jgi:hypothetical protein
MTSKNEQKKSDWATLTSVGRNWLGVVELAGAVGAHTPRGNRDQLLA